jgi:hypothetical protein
MRPTYIVFVSVAKRSFELTGSASPFSEYIINLGTGIGYASLMDTYNKAKGRSEALTVSEALRSLPYVEITRSLHPSRSVTANSTQRFTS